MRCFIIDDEPLAIDVVESFLEKIGGMEIVGKTTNPLDAVTQLSQKQVDLVFLDIEMPNLTGIDLVKTLDNIPQFIFTTAYPQYALDGFNLNATDYLVKPIPFQRFLKAIARAKEKYEARNISNAVAPIATAVSTLDFQSSYIFVKSEYENVKIAIDTITHIEGLKDYLKIYTTTATKAILTLSSFKEILERLPAHNFMRVHRSYVVNIDHIKALQRSRIILETMRIPIGETYKVEVLNRLKIG